MPNMQSSKDLGKMALLKRLIEDQFGRPVGSYGDCLILSEQIFVRTGQTLNVNTLRRLFGLVPYDGFPSRTTLNILAQYCGFGAFEEIGTPQPEDCSPNSLEWELVQFLTSLFHTEEEPAATPCFRNTYLQTRLLLRRKPGLAMPFLKELVRHEAQRRLFFTAFVNLDELNTYYGSGLCLWLAETQSAEEQAFAHGLLCYGAWLSGSREGVERHFGALSDTGYLPGANCTVAAWYYAAELLFYAGKPKPFGKVLDQARAYYEKHQPVHKGHASFAFILCRVLVALGEADAAQYFLDWSIRHLFKQHQADEGGLLQSLLLLEAQVLHGQGRSEAARQQLARVDPAQFHPLSVKLESLHYYQLLLQLQDADENAVASIGSLVAETGFNRFRQEAPVLAS